MQAAGGVWAGWALWSHGSLREGGVMACGSCAWSGSVCTQRGVKCPSGTSVFLHGSGCCSSHPRDDWAMGMAGRGDGHSPVQLSYVGSQTSALWPRACHWSLLVPSIPWPDQHGHAPLWKHTQILGQGTRLKASRNSRSQAWLP